jgi:hypothetical protein
MEWEIGATDVPNSTDCPINWDISEQTADGTATALTPRLNDVGGGDAAALGTYAANATAEGTVTASSSAWFLALNQRASYRIQMRDEFHALIVPAVNLKGLRHAREIAELRFDGWLARSRQGISDASSPRLRADHWGSCPCARHGRARCCQLHSLRQHQHGQIIHDRQTRGDGVPQRRYPLLQRGRVLPVVHGADLPAV